MSGGYFSYRHYQIDLIIEELDLLIRKRSSEYSEETITELKKSLLLLKKAAFCIQQIDWLASSDISEDSFHDAIKEDFSN